MFYQYQEFGIIEHSFRNCGAVCFLLFEIFDWNYVFGIFSWSMKRRGIMCKLIIKISHFQLFKINTYQLFILLCDTYRILHLKYTFILYIESAVFFYLACNDISISFPQCRLRKFLLYIIFDHFFFFKIYLQLSLAYH